MSIGRAHLVAVAAGGCLLLGTTVADAGTAPPIGCGSTITRSTTLRADIVGCPATALVIGADRITLDLGGHTISGTNAVGSEGIANDGHAGVRIVGRGSVRDFQLTGVAMRNAPGSVVRGLTIGGIGAGLAEEGGQGGAGILIADSPSSQVSGNEVANDVESFQSDGVDVLRSPGALVAGNDLSHNNWNGLVLLESPASRIVRNDLDDNGNNGTEVNGSSDGVTVTANSAARNTQFGIVVGASRNVRVAGNAARHNDTGIFFFDLHDSVITANRATGNVAGIVLAGGQSGSDGNHVTGNVASRNSEIGFSLEGGANDNVVSGNIANANQGDGGGIRVQGAARNQLSGNVASSNNDSGIIVADDQAGDSSGNSLRRNSANGNGGHGIDASASSLDGGGNRAVGNVTQPQCITVVCAG
jgi:parallel beta-helix repeat protein